ncbi:PREDICTED: receptor-like protein kinase FERONIA [Erythranthe guttata]|uniref:receptor-like protein kinase FERONIA n=1 Tax=Erythranthe guttata TaxID=4155 RepID=UPI00064DB3F2|nr:PREDICTED: receptor-like protein kinase FERONIA [Erythranthe guttata]|eukprot:XP_012855250.1 PREDICTED: receptor-like protein kinase FERONIA [Erythranthe guttata]
MGGQVLRRAAPNHIRQEKDSAYSSFALVLFHVLFFKAGEQPKVTEWAEFCRTETLKQYMDTNLYNQIAPDCLSKFIETTLACRNRNVSEQLATSDVVRSLELAVQLQEAAEQRGSRRWWGLFQK